MKVSILCKEKHMGLGKEHQDINILMAFYTETKFSDGIGK